MTGSLPTEIDERHDPPQNDAPLAYSEPPPPVPYRMPRPARVGPPPAMPPPPDSAAALVAPSAVFKPPPAAGTKKVR